jgi:hypothetical protein
MSTDSSLSFLAKLKNKALYQVEKWVNDPEANTFASSRASSEPVKEQVKEALEDLPAEEEQEPTSDSAVIRVLQKMMYYTKRILAVAFFPFLAALLASTVANEMIIYPAPIRLIFFLFTLVLCLLSRVVLVLLGAFFLCKWGFHYYVNNMSDGPKRLIAPTLFAFLPLTPRESENPLLNALLRPFQYGERWSAKDGEELQTRMDMYQQTLKEAFPYVEQIQTTEPFQSQLGKIETRFRELHRAMAPPPSQPEPEPEPKPQEAPKAPTAV